MFCIKVFGCYNATMKLSSVLGFLGVVFLFVAPLALFNVDKTMPFPYVTGPSFGWRLLVEVAFILWASAAILNKKYWINLQSPITIALICFVVIVGISNIFGLNPYLSFWSNAERMDGYIGLIHLFLFYLAGVGLLTSNRLVYGYLFYLTMVGLLISIIGLGQNKERIYSVLGNPIYLSSLSLFGIFFSIFFIAAQKKLSIVGKTPQIFFVGTVLIFLLTMYQTGTRGAVLGLFAGIISFALVIIVLAKKDEYKILKKSSWVIVLAVLSLVACFFVSKDYLATQSFVQESPLLSRAVRISLEDRTTSFRLTNWQMALEGFKERPLLGWGQENYTAVFTKYYQVEKLYDTEPWYDRSHNVFLDWLVFSGIFGLLGYLGIFLTTLWVIVKKLSISLPLKATLIGLIFGYLVQNFVAFDALVSGIYITFIFILATSLSRVEKKEEKDILRPQNFFIILFLIITLLYSVQYTIIIPMQAGKNFISFISYRDSTSLDEAAMNRLTRYLEPALSSNSFLTKEILQQTNRLKTTFLNQKHSSSTIVSYIQILDTYFESSIAKDFQDARHIITYADFLIHTGRYTEALAWLDSAHSITPTKPEINLLYGTALVRIGQKEEGLLRIQSTIDQIPEYSLAKEVYEKLLGQ